MDTNHNPNITLISLCEMMNEAYRNKGFPLTTREVSDARERANKLFDDHFTAAIKNTYPNLFNDKIVSLISSEAYDRGHYAGTGEVVSQAMNLAEFVKTILEASK